MPRAPVVMVYVVMALMPLGPANPQKADLPQAPSSPYTFLYQPPNQVGGLFSDADCDSCQGGVQVLAENFEWESDVCWLSFWGGYLPGDAPPQDSFTVIFHEDAGGVPGPVVASYSGLVPNRSATGNTVLGVDEYRYNLAIDPSADLSGSFSHWIEIYNDTEGSPESFFWETGEIDPIVGLPGHALAPESPGSNWQVKPDSELALELIGDGCDVPAVSPRGLWVLAITLFAVAGLALRRRAARS